MIKKLEVYSKPIARRLAMHNCITLYITQKENLLLCTGSNLNDTNILFIPNPNKINTINIYDNYPCLFSF
jgi:hypothetical protein